MAQKLADNRELGAYGYSDRPLREEIVREINDRDGGRLAVITRNSYGSLVLNTSRAMFIDIDFQPRGLLDSIKSLLGLLTGKKVPSAEALALRTVEERAAEDPARGLRVYRTRGGLRCLVTDLPHDPATAQSEAILRSFGCDPHYLRLCTAQECFRARLTPKPWRCRLAKPPGRYPWDDPEEESRCRQWEQRYQAAIAGCAACRMITSFGNPHIHPDIQPVVALHDELACGDDVARLA